MARFDFQERFLGWTIFALVIGGIALAAGLGSERLWAGIFVGSVIGVMVGLPLAALLLATHWVGGKVYDWRESHSTNQPFTPP